MDTAPLFSFIAFVDDDKHFLCSTLDSLRSQTDKRFEVVLIDGIGHGKVEEVVKPYSDLSIRIHPGIGKTGSERMNEGAGLARGKYLQFLHPGDRYLSREGLSYLAELIDGHNEPHLIYSGFLIRGSEAILFPLNSETLQKGVFSRESWFLRKAVLDMGGFDAALSYRSAFDLLCRFFFKQGGLRSVCSRRVLTDTEPKAPLPRAMMGYAVETYRILYRHFGLWTAIRWVFVQNHLQMFRWLGSHFKRAFWNE